MKIRNNLFDKVLNKLLKRILEYPDIELCSGYQIIRRRKTRPGDLCGITLPIHWGCAWQKASTGNHFRKHGSPIAGIHS
jgi:hypothetical protein